MEPNTNTNPKSLSSGLQKHCMELCMVSYISEMFVDKLKFTIRATLQFQRSIDMLKFTIKETLQFQTSVADR